MYWVLILVGIGSAYWTAQSIAPAIFAGIAVGLITLPIILAAEWINDFTGISHLLVGSWQALSGVDAPGEVVVSCDTFGDYNDTTTTTFGDVLIALLVLIIAIANFIPGVIAIVGIPVGLAVGGVGAFRYFTVGKRDWVRTGLGILSVAVGAVIVAGLVMRLMHFLSASTC